MDVFEYLANLPFNKPKANIAIPAKNEHLEKEGVADQK